MAKIKTQTDRSPEIQAIATVYDALKGLDLAVQERVIRFVGEMLGTSVSSTTPRQRAISGAEEMPEREPPARDNPIAQTLSENQAEEAEGISPVALKWMRRSGFDAKRLQDLFSLGIDDIDLVAKSVPGSSKRERMHNVILLKGVAAYLGTGVARASHEQVKEACLHYDAYDVTNFARYLKEFSSDISGSKESGYSLTARGLNEATNLVKQMLRMKEERK